MLMRSASLSKRADLDRRRVQRGRVGWTGLPAAPCATARAGGAVRSVQADLGKNSFESCRPVDGEGIRRARHPQRVLRTQAAPGRGRECRKASPGSAFSFAVAFCEQHHDASDPEDRAPRDRGDATAAEPPAPTEAKSIATARERGSANPTARSIDCDPGDRSAHADTKSLFGPEAMDYRRSGLHRRAQRALRDLARYPRHGARHRIFHFDVVGAAGTAVASPSEDDGASTVMTFETTACSCFPGLARRSGNRTQLDRCEQGVFHEHQGGVLS